MTTTPKTNPAVERASEMNTKTAFLFGVEFGYRGCERGDNLQATMHNAATVEVPDAVKVLYTELAEAAREVVDMHPMAHNYLRARTRLRSVLEKIGK